MWSEIFNYYNIQYDEKFSQKLDKSVVVKCILETELFKQINHQSFTNSDKFPWVDILLVETYNGNFTSSEKENQFVTLIAIVCSKGENINQYTYIEVFYSPTSVTTSIKSLPKKKESQRKAFTSTFLHRPCEARSNLILKRNKFSLSLPSFTHRLCEERSNLILN